MAASSADEEPWAYLPLSVSIIGFAFKDKRQMELMGTMLSAEWHRIDVREKLRKDPSKSGLSHEHNGRDRSTQHAMLTTENFAEVTVSQIARVLTEPDYRAITLGCTSNHHRSLVGCGSILLVGAQGVTFGNVGGIMFTFQILDVDS